MYYGIDGCSGGWVYIGLSESNEYTFGVAHTISDFWQVAGHHARQILIDIPIGLASRDPRRPEIEARKILRQRASRIFDVPLRPALAYGAQMQFAPASYPEACQINQGISGKRFSKQTWQIMPKIHEVDLFLRQQPAAQVITREIHPEVLFWALAGQPARYSKKTGLGFCERIHLLKQFIPHVFEMVEAIYQQHHRQLVDDDIVDALVAAVSARLGNLASLPAEVTCDEYGLPMQMFYPQLTLLPDAAPDTGQSAPGC